MSSKKKIPAKKIAPKPNTVAIKKAAEKKPVTRKAISKEIKDMIASFKSIPHKKVLDKLLEKVKYVDFQEKAELKKIDATP